MKFRHLLIALLILGACAAGFFAGHLLSRNRCPPSVTVQLQDEIKGLHVQIASLKQNLQKIRDAEKEHK